MNRDTILMIVQNNSPIDVLKVADLADSNKPKRPDTIIGGVKSALESLYTDGLITHIGSKYSGKYGKLFDVYSGDLRMVKEQKNGYEMRQKNTQIIALAKTLYAEFKEHLQIQPLKDALQMISDGKGKISLEYHMLELPQVISVYKRVIADAAEWFVAEQEYYKRPNYTGGGTLIKWKNPLLI